MTCLCTSKNTGTSSKQETTRKKATRRKEQMGCSCEETENRSRKQRPEQKAVHTLVGFGVAFSVQGCEHARGGRGRERGSGGDDRCGGR